MNRLWAALRRWSGRVTLVLAVVLLVVTGSFLLAPTRGIWLSAGLSAASRGLPGDLSGDWSWPRLNRIEGRSVVWTVPVSGAAERDTLAVVRHLAVQVDLQALRAHDLRVEDLRLDAVLLDVPRITAVLPATAPAPVASDSTGAAPWLRQGSVAGQPSVGVARLDLAVERLVLTEEIQVRALQLAGSATALADDAPRLVLDRCSGRAAAAGARRWSADLAGSGSWRGGVWDVESSTGFHVDVPDSLQSPVPGVVIQDLVGRLEARFRGTVREAQLDVSLALDPSTDVRRGRLEASFLGGLQPEPELREVRLESLDLQWRRTAVEAGGSWDGTVVDGWARVDLQDLELPTLLAPDLPAGVHGRIRVAATVAGPLLDPAISGTVVARGGVASVWTLPGVAAAAAGLPPSFPRAEFQRVDLDLEAGFAGSAANLDVDVRADVGRTPWLDRGLFAGRVRVSPRDRVLGELRLDSLAVALRGADVLISGRADTVGADLVAALTVAGTGLLDLAAPAALPGADVALAAELGVAGPWRNPRVDAVLHGRLATADFSLPMLSGSVRGSAEAIAVRARTAGDVRLGTVALDSLAVVWDGRLDPTGGVPPGDFDVRAWAPAVSAWLHGSAAGDTVRTVRIDTLVFIAAGQVITSTEPTTLRLGPGPRDAALEGFRLRGDPGRLDIAGRVAESGLSATAATDLLLTREWLDTLFPSPFWSAGGGVDLAVEGGLDLSTFVADGGGGLAFAGRSALRLIPRNQDPPAQLDVDLRLARGDTAGLAADVRFGVGSTQLVHGTLLWPGRIDPERWRWVSEGDAADAIRIPEQELPLAFFNRFLPAEVSLAGALTVGAGLAMTRSDSATAPMTDSAVSGRVRARDLRVNLPNRSRVNLDGEIGLEGTLNDPLLAGAITVTSGLFRLPEIQRSLLPTTGRSELWTAAHIAGATPMWIADAPMTPPAAPFVPDLDLRVVLPGNFKVVGYGLETELAGEIRIGRGWDENDRPVPVLRGRIRVVEGTLRALNRIFDVERGEFDLQGRIPTDPAVNLVMVTDIDGTVVRIRVTGTALQPRVVLESEPEMIQADIMAFVLFGRPLNDLDTDQRGSLREEQTPAQQLRQNLQGLALVFGAAGVQNTVSGNLGVDQVQIGSDTAGGSALVLGKFINPRTLLKYHQSLERSGTYFMTIEYAVSRLFKLISTYGQGEEASGLELRWQRRY